MRVSLDADGARAHGLRDEPLPDGWLNGIVAPPSTVGGVVALLGTWATGIGTTLLAARR